MSENEVLDLLQLLAKQQVTPHEALAKLQAGPFQRLSAHSAELDSHRGLRHGLHEVIYGEHKTLEQLSEILQCFSVVDQPVLCTRLTPEKLPPLQAQFPLAYANPIARTFTLNRPDPAQLTITTAEPFVALVCAGSADLPVLEEAKEVCIAMNTRHIPIVDIGISGLQRLVAQLPLLQQASAIVVIAGMEGALPSVVAGLIGRPLFAVPTSVGYGVNFHGLTPLLAMLNSCAPGVSVVNIDNGFSAAFAACQVVRAILRDRQQHACV